MKLLEIGRLRHELTLHRAGTPTADGDGSFTQTPVALSPPTIWAEIAPATSRELERITAGTVMSTATHVIRCRYHAGITTQTRITFGTRTFNVIGVQNLQERNLELEILAVEVVT